VTSAEANKISRGSSVKLVAEAGSVIGKVRQMAPNLDAQTRNAIVYVDLTSAGAGSNALRVGQFVRGDFLGASKNALVLPSTAVVQRDGFAYVFVHKAGKVVQTKVTLGQRVGSTVELVSGIDGSAAVVATGAAFLTDGDVVKVVQP
jgi:HlyD family secretion protein